MSYITGCGCGKNHFCAINNIVVRENAILSLPDLCSKYEHIHLVYDMNTFEAAGRQVRKLLDGSVSSETLFGKELLIPDEKAVALIEETMPESTDLIVGTGSGVIQDLCKFTGTKRNLPYFIVATAPSMDGYGSSGAAMIMNGMKITYPARVADSIVCDVNVLKEAPLDMIRAGYGDVIGKFSCLNDWKLSALVNGEYFCDRIYGMVNDMLGRVRDSGEKLQKRDPSAIKSLTDALIGVGVAMAYAGSTRPGSGSEHHLSHFFEIVGIVRGEPYFPHGIDVACSTVKTAEIRHELLNTDNFEFQKFNRDEWIENIRRVYGKISGKVIEFQDGLGHHSRDMSSVYSAKRDEIKGILSDSPGPDIIRNYLESAGIEYDGFERLYGAEKISDAIRFGMDLKDRYSVLWLYNSIRH
ncbi:MAG: sn-glycerol-1-phosphate dehydrogenase [Clostridia bacterium]|nr:sn-glycerol-1-phosphate dehydrogenase [Clostridia bacterium]